MLSSIDQEFTIENGKLNAPLQADYGSSVTRALHNSNVAYGKWSFEWTASSTQPSYDGFEFILTDYASSPYDYEGRNFPSIDHLAGYALVVSNYASNLGNGFGFVKFENSSSNSIPKLLKTYSFDSNINGSHNFEITRDNNGQFNISFDSILRMQVTDTTFTTSEVFTFVSFQGNSSIDNIVIEAPTKSSPFTPFPIIALGFVGITTIQLLRRKIKNN